MLLQSLNNLEPYILDYIPQSLRNQGLRFLFAGEGIANRKRVFYSRKSTRDVLYLKNYTNISPVDILIVLYLNSETLACLLNYN